jgi:hypothetical protein
MSILRHIANLFHRSKLDQNIEAELRSHMENTRGQSGSLCLTEITTKAVQGFVAHLAEGGRCRKTTENVLLTLSSLLKSH